jgi:hypothetical protein
MNLRCLFAAFVDRIRARPRLADPAETRARELLLRMLDPVQRKDFELNGYFAVKVTGRGTFWILPSTFFNVLRAETGDCYCAAPRAELPLSDLMLAQKLLLEANPEVFFSVANRRAELIPGSASEQSLPRRVLKARASLRPTRVRWSEVAVMPHGPHLP